jgi:hypothetical protein
MEKEEIKKLIEEKEFSAFEVSAAYSAGYTDGIELVTNFWDMGDIPEHLRSYFNQLGLKKGLEFVKFLEIEGKEIIKIIGDE